MSLPLLPAGSVVVLGEVPRADLPRYATPEALPDGARLVVVESRAERPADTVARVRRRLPEARLIAWLAAPSDEAVARCIDRGFDDVSFGERHLEHCLWRWSRNLELAERNAEQQEIHRGLVNLLEEINERPELADVLCTSVLRMSELFDIDRVSVVLLKPGEEVAFVVAEHEEALIENLVIRISDYPELRAMIERRQPVVIPDTLGENLLSGVRQKLERAKAPPRLSVLFPLMHHGEVVGALFLRDKQPRAHVEERLMRMGQLIAVVTSVAIGAALEQDTLQSEQRALKRKKAEVDEKIAGLQQFSDFFAQSHDGIVVTDEQGAIRYANAAAGTVLARDPQALQGLSFVSLLGGRSRVIGERALGGESVGDKFGYVDLAVPIGDEREVIISAAARKMEQPAGVLISFRDVTELRELEAELKQTKEFLENLIQSSVDAIVAAEVTGPIILFNRAAERILGYSAREVVGRMNVATIYPPDEARDVMRRLRSDAYGGRGRLEMTRKDLVAKDGTLVPVSLTAAVIYEGEREVATVGVFTDLRERLKIEERLDQVQRQLQTSERQAVAVELAGAAAHELNQPLTSILGYAEMLRRRLPDGDPNRKPVDVICRESERMAEIVKKIGQITAYETKPYVGGSQILDLGAVGGDEPAK